MFRTTPTGTNSDLPRLIFKLETASNQMSTILSSKSWSRSVSQKMRISSAKRRWDITKEHPSIRPSLTALSNILPTTFMTIMNNNRDNGLPCLNPLQVPKKSQGEPLIKMEKWTVNKQKKIHCLHFSKKPQHLRKGWEISNSHDQKPSLHPTLDNYVTT